MSLELPELDDTSYEELVENAKQRIAARTDEWTDFNPHDPGITILELLAWLTDTHIYEADQLTDRHRKKYLQLLGGEPTPPQPATVTLEISPTDGSGRLPAGTRLLADDGSQQLPFETDSPITVTDSSVEAVVVNGESRTNANETDGMRYRLFGNEPTAGDWFAVGFDGDPFAGAELELFVEYDEGALPSASPGDTELFDPSVELCWEYCGVYPPTGEADWKRLDVRADTTNSLYERGVITFERPEPWEPAAWGCDEAGCFDSPAGLVWIRCRLTRGGYEIPPQCRTMQPNVVTASHCCGHDEQLTPADDGPAGGATRTYEFEHAPVLEATVIVDGEPWTEVSDFDASGPTDCHYVLDRAAGELTVGDGQRGAHPPAGAPMQASYEAGGGTVGNVSENARWSVSDQTDSLPAVEIEPLGPATGGRDAEPLEEAIDRCRAELETTQRAVRADEYGALAESTPGVRVARSTVRLPETDSEPIRVIVVPHAPPDVQRPTPSEGFTQAVETYLDRHRLLGDRIEVRGPKYVELTVELAVGPTATHTEGEARRQVERHLGSTLDPLGGPDGNGWPFGQSLSERYLRQTVHELPAVDDVKELTIRTVGDTTVTTDGQLLIDDSTLFTLEAVEIDCRGTAGGGD